VPSGKDMFSDKIPNAKNKNIKIQKVTDFSNPDLPP
jgi:hypothetical protein